MWMKKNMRDGEEKYRYGSSSSSSCSSSPTAQAPLGRSEQQQLQLGSFPARSSSTGLGVSAGLGVSGGMEKEHMFDKVVTPSDVGKLNRLVIPKQHAEKYFPLDSSTNDKGLLLNFEDRSGKPWRFRYSYWNSSQSYVMTKGWSRFVKEKKLDAGDIVSFQRGMGDAAKDRLFIDWRRRPEAPSPALPHHFAFHPPTWNHPPPQYYLPHFHPPPPFHRPLQPHLISRLGNPISARPRPAPEEVVFESVPVAQGKAAAKRLRLFGVNITTHADTSSAPPPAHNVGLFLGNPNPCSSSSMSLDLDI